MTGWSRFVPWLVVGVAVLYLGLAALMAQPGWESSDQMHLQEFARLPVQEGGRVKPLDTFARNSFMAVSDRQQFTDDSGHTYAALPWLLDVMTSQLKQDSTAEKQEVIRIDNDQVLNMLGLKEKPGFHYSIDELRDKIPEIGERAGRATKAKNNGIEPDLTDEKFIRLAERLQVYVNIANFSEPYTVPPRSRGEKWKTLIDAVAEVKQGGGDNPGARSMVTLLLSYMENKPDAFNRELADYRHRLEGDMPATLAHTDFEYFFNNFAPFKVCAFLYVATFLLVCFSWVGWAQPLNRAAFGLLVVTLLVHTAALIGRMYLMERWFVFVTNLYSSAVFIGWGCAVVALILELIFRNGIGNIVAAVAGFVTMIIAHNLAGAGDTLEMMRAVLDTNFWLATHVTCVTLGYTATFVAGLLGILFILRGVLTGSLDRPTFTAITQALYGVVCFATLLSFTGTVLGGIWADQSWGRFWGWDPKENGALIIVIWNALILHARWAGLVKQRGTAVLAVFGNIVTLWSWFGVNMLGVGLHSYGFMAFNAVLLATFIPFHLAVIALGLVPVQRWRSFGRYEPPTVRPLAA
jgi:ABC-type transport system involved in cytochrome c biogenesis permease subunit